MRITNHLLLFFLFVSGHLFSEGLLFVDGQFVPRPYKFEINNRSISVNGVLVHKLQPRVPNPKLSPEAQKKNIEYEIQYLNSHKQSIEMLSKSALYFFFSKGGTISHGTGLINDLYYASKVLELNISTKLKVQFLTKRLFPPHGDHIMATTFAKNFKLTDELKTIFNTHPSRKDDPDKQKQLNEFLAIINKHK